MKLSRLILLLAILAGAGLTPLTAQITLTNKQFDFYARALVIKQELMRDTAYLRQDLRDCATQTRLDSLRNSTHDAQFSGCAGQLKGYQESYQSLQMKYEKKEKWNGRLKKGIVVISVVSILEGFGLYFAFKK